MALDALEPFDPRRQLGRAAGGVDAVLHARRALLPLPLVDGRPGAHVEVFPPFESRPVTALRGRRVGVVGSAGGGACVALVGVARALEEAGVEPAAISACSSSVLWAAMWAAGLASGEMAELALGWRPEAELGIQWAGIPRFALSVMRGYSGLRKGDAVDALLGRRLTHMSVGETPLPLRTAVYNLDRARLEEFGSEQTPELSLGELARVAVAGPSAGEAVRVEGDLYVDGSVLDPFPAERFAADDGFDRVFALNASLPPGLDGAGERHRGADSERRLRLAQQLELARRTRERLGERLTLIEPLTDRPGTGSPFYDLFLDRRRWPDLMRAGYERTIEALRPLRRRRGGAR